MDTFVQQLINGLTIGSIYALIALGYTMVYGILRLINFAHGDIYMVGAYAGFILATSLGFAAQPSAFGFIVTLIGSMIIAAARSMFCDPDYAGYRMLRNTLYIAVANSEDSRQRAWGANKRIVFWYRTIRVYPEYFSGRPV